MVTYFIYGISFPMDCTSITWDLHGVHVAVLLIMAFAGYLGNWVICTNIGYNTTVCCD